MTIKAKERENELPEETQGTGFHWQDQAQRRRGTCVREVEDVVGRAHGNFVGLHLGSWVQSFNSEPPSVSFLGHVLSFGSVRGGGMRKMCLLHLPESRRLHHIPEFRLWRWERLSDCPPDTQNTR